MRNPKRTTFLFATLVALVFACQTPVTVDVTGELKQWHKVTLTMDGPEADEADTEVNPFLDYRMTGIITHESGSPSYTIPGYFAADGNAGETSASSGNKWRVHISPDKRGRWDYQLRIEAGAGLAIADISQSGEIVNQASGSFEVGTTDKTGRDFRSGGRLQYVGERYLRFAGSGKYFLKAGADSPENLLAYEDFDGTRSIKGVGEDRPDEAPTTKLKTWNPHTRDWKEGDPTWQGGKGKGLIGALNYLASTGVNSFSFLTYNVGGDGEDVWPYVEPKDKFHFDCSKLDQWQIVFDHGQQLGLYLHFKLQETENDDNDPEPKIAALDGGDLGPERKLYLRELTARFGYELALNWNIGEENTQTTEQQEAMASYIRTVDPYDHHIVLHTYPGQQDRKYTPHLGPDYTLTGLSLQNMWSQVHQLTLHWIEASGDAGKQWVVANDEQNPHYTGVPPDTGYEGFSGVVDYEKIKTHYTLHDIRKYCLWGNLMAGGAGVEYYFGYTLPQNDLGLNDWRSRDESWRYAAIALDFFASNEIPFWEMANKDALVGNPDNDNSRYCFAKEGELYLVYLPDGGTTELDLSGQGGTYEVLWHNPRTGGELSAGSVKAVKGGSAQGLGMPPTDSEEDWMVVVRNKPGLEDLLIVSAG